MSFSAMKKARSGQLEKLQKQLSEASKPNYKNDDDGLYWKPERDESGNGEAIIRFLPPCENEEHAYIKMFDHGFQGPTGKWYIEKSLSTIGKDDPVGKMNSALWATGNEADKETARKQKRRTKWIANILVIKDSKNPQNNGQVKLFPFGKKIFDMIKDQMSPEFEGEDPVNPFDFWDGADFALRIRTVDRFPNYDKSKFLNPAPLFGGDDDKLEAIWKQQHSLNALLDPSNFKTYEELEAKLNMVLGNGNTAKPAGRAETQNLDNDDEDDLAAFRGKTAAAPAQKEAPARRQAAAAPADDDDEDELAMFRQMAGNS